MAFDGYLNVEGVPGEATDSEHKDWITIKGFSHMVSMPMTEERHDGGPGPGQRSDHGQFSIEKRLDSTTPTLSLFCCQGKSIGTVKVDLCRTIAEKSVPYMQYEMKDVFITRVAPQGRAAENDGRMPVEEVTFNYGKIVWKYTHTDQKTGAKGKEVETNWNTITNKQE